MTRQVEVFVKKGLSQNTVKKNLAGVPDAEYRIVTQVEDLSRDIDTPLISMGGEGTLLLAMQYLLDLELTRQTIGLFPAGMNNVLHTTLVTAKQSQTVPDFFREIKADQRNEKFRPYRPGVINFESPQLFFNHVGFGSFEVRNSLYSELLRMLGSSARKSVAPLAALAAELFNPTDRSDILSIYSTIPTMANRLVFPGQDVFDSKVTHIQLEKSHRLQNIRKLFLILLMWKRGLPTKIPQDVLKITQCEAFELAYVPQPMWIDGDPVIRSGTAPLKSEKLTVSRSTTGQYITALTPTQE